MSVPQRPRSRVGGLGPTPRFPYSRARPESLWNENSRPAILDSAANRVVSLPNPFAARGPLKAAATLAVAALVYFGLAKAGLVLASVNPSASPIWPPTGFAIAAVLLWGYRVWPAILLAAFIANLTNAGSLATSAAIATGNVLECLIAGFLINLWSGGRETFATPTRIAKFALVCLLPTALSATMGVWSLTLAGYAQTANFLSIWLTWWVGDLAGAIVVTPVVVLWAASKPEGPTRPEAIKTGAVLAATCAIGLLAFSPLLPQTGERAALGFFAVLPLIWAALHRGQRDTATVALILSAFAVWGTAVDGGPFARTNLNESFLLLLTFILSVALPSLALAAEVSVRRETQEELRRIQSELDQRVRDRTAELAEANRSLSGEIDRRKMIEAELRLQSAHLSEAQRFANLGSWVWDMAHGTVTWSNQLYEIYGLKPGEFGGTFESFLSCVHEDDRDRIRAEVTKAYQSGQPFRLEERIVRPDGEIRNLQSSGEVIKNERGNAIRMLGICQDVTEQKQAASSLREVETQYRLMIESVHDYAIYMLDPNGNISSWNTGAERIKQYSAAEVLGTHFGRFYIDAERETGLPERALRIAEHEGKYEAEGWRLRKDGTTFWASVIIDPIRDDKGALLGFAKITRDITERREADERLEAAREQLVQSQKMEALGQLTGGIAHDFNNLLMIMSGHAQMLRRRLSDPSQLRSVDAIHAAASRGESLTRQLLAFSRRQALHPAVVDLRERIEAVREMLGSSLRGDIELELDIAEGLWRTEVDLAELELALVNVAVNARDAMPEGGKITLSARNVRLKRGQIEDLEGEFIALSLTDAGGGIPPEIMPRIFEPFFTTKSVGRGTGLGLSQVYGFAHQSGGAVKAVSAVGRGTTVTIYLPRSEAALSVLPEPVAEPPPARAGGTILAVEDNREVAEVTARMLEDMGYRVLLVQNAPDALLLLQHNDKIDLVFSDIVMPGAMNGLALAREIKTRFPGIPVVLTSGYSDAVQSVRSQFTILRKPFQATDLQRILRDVFRAKAMAHGGVAAPPRRSGEP